MLLHIFLTLFFAAYVASILWARIAGKLRFFARSGGIVVVVLFVAATFFEASIGLQSPFEWNRIRFVDDAAITFAWIGFLDDRRDRSGADTAFLQILSVFAVSFFLFQPFVFPTELLYFSPIQGLSLLKIGSVFGLCFIAGNLLVYVNSFRSLERIDGLAPALGTVYAGTLETVVLAWEEPSLNMTFACLALIAFLTGFLLLNLPPAKIRVGNAGSLSIGLLLACLTFCVFSYREYIRVVPILCLWTLPTIEFALRIARRWSPKTSDSSPNQEGLCRSLRRRLGKDSYVLLAILALQMPLSAAVVVSYKTGYDFVSLVVAALYWAGLLLSNLFGKKELKQIYLLVEKRSKNDAQDGDSFDKENAPLNRKEKEEL